MLRRMETLSHRLRLRLLPLINTLKFFLNNNNNFILLPILLLLRMAPLRVHLENEKPLPNNLFKTIQTLIDFYHLGRFLPRVNSQDTVQIVSLLSTID